MITTCTTCGKCYEAGSEEQANEPVRPCPDCWKKQKESPTPCNPRLAKILAGCVKCGRHGPAARQQAASTNELATGIQAAEDVVDPHAVPTTCRREHGFRPDPVPPGVMESIASMGAEQDRRNAAAVWSDHPELGGLAAQLDDDGMPRAGKPEMCPTPRVPDQWSTEHLAVLDLMESEGGSFVSALALAWRRGDMTNQAKLYEAFGHYYADYRSKLMARRAARGGAR